MKYVINTVTREILKFPSMITSTGKVIPIDLKSILASLGKNFKEWNLFCISDSGDWVVLGNALYLRVVLRKHRYLYIIGGYYAWDMTTFVRFSDRVVILDKIKPLAFKETINKLNKSFAKECLQYEIPFPGTEIKIDLFNLPNNQKCTIF